MIQQILLAIIFTGALFYVGRIIYSSFQATSACSSGCGKCTIDFTKIEKQLKAKG